MERNSVDGSTIMIALKLQPRYTKMACVVPRLLRLRLLVVLVRRFRIWTPSAAVSALLRARRRQPAKLATATRHGADTASATLQTHFFQKLHLIRSETVCIIPYHIALRCFKPYLILIISFHHQLRNHTSGLRLGTASFTFSTSTTPLRPRAEALASV